jgi:hypothetical protein
MQPARSLKKRTKVHLKDKDIVARSPSEILWPCFAPNEMACQVDRNNGARVRDLRAQQRASPSVHHHHEAWQGA